jgi:tetratricopeptide (TPR) repeat protein
VPDIDWDTVDEIFQTALAAPAADRPALVARLAGQRPAIAREVLSLLAAYEGSQSDAFLEPLAMGAPAPAPAALDGARIGPYELIREIGHGGMGTVYLGRRADGLFTHDVAVKLTRWPMPDAEASRRFAAERRILASIQHPNIVTLLDGGATVTGHPYLITEYIDGQPLTAWIRERRLPLDQRLQLFRQVCAGVHAAHQHGIVHRDLKPGNILVTAGGVAKILDFGIAKVLDAGGDEETRVTAPAAFTPGYASPEQLRHQAVTTASDVYALGVLLYEIVSGKRPHEPEGRPLDEVLTEILSGSTTRPSDAGRGAADLPYDPGRLRGDLDAIVLMAMRVEPGNRYASVDELSRDIARYLDGQPIAAREPSLRYVVGKIVVRHRAAAVVATLGLAGILAALGAALWQRQQADAARIVAETRFNEVRQLANALIFKIDAAVLTQSPTEARRVIVSEALQYLGRLEASSSEPGLRLELADGYRRVGEIQGARGTANLGDRAGALTSLQRALNLAQPLEGDAAHRARARELLVGIHRLMAAAQSPPASRQSAQAALEVAQRWAAEDPGDAARRALAAAHYSVAGSADPAGLRRHMEAAGREFEALLARQPDDPDRLRNVALVDKNLVDLLDAAGEHAEALRRAERAVRLDARRLELMPANRQARLDAAISYAQLASLTIGPHERLALYEQSLALRDAVVREDPADEFSGGVLRRSLAQVASERLATGNADGAREAADRAMGLYAAAQKNPLTDYELMWRARAQLVLATLDGRAGRVERGCARLQTAETDIATARRVARVEYIPQDALDAARAALRSCK